MADRCTLGAHLLNRAGLTRLLLWHSGLAQAVEEVIDTGLVPIQSLQGGLDKRKIWIEAFQIGKRGLRLLDLTELSECGNHVG